MFNNILLATDFSKHSEIARKIAISLTKGENKKLTVLHVFNYQDVLVQEGAFISSEIVHEQMLKSHKKELDKIMKEFCQEIVINGINYENIILEGEPAEIIVQKSNEIDSDLIVIGSHSKRSMFDVILGGTATDVSKKARCPVLIATSFEREPEVINITIGSEVECTNGICGRVRRIILDPEKNQISHVVVGKGMILSRDIVLPVKDIKSSSEDKLYISKSIKELEQLPDYEKTKYVQPKFWDYDLKHEPSTILFPYGAFLWQSGLLMAPHIEMEAEKVEGIKGIEINKGTEIYSSDSHYIGTVDNVLMNAETNLVTHIIVNKGGLFRDNITVPIESVKEINASRIILAMDKETADKL